MLVRVMIRAGQVFSVARELPVQSAGAEQAVMTQQDLWKTVLMASFVDRERSLALESVDMVCIACVVSSATPS